MTVAVELEWGRRFPQLQEPRRFTWSEQPVVVLDRGLPWLYGPVERDPLMTARGHVVLPRREIKRLRALEDDGHEIYLHGYYHRSRRWDDPDTVGSRANGVVDRMRHMFAQKVVSASEAEFSDVSQDEALARLDAGERVLRDAGLTISGFVATTSIGHSSAAAMPKTTAPDPPHSSAAVNCSSLVAGVPASR